jgi:hypothetical protein
MNNKDLLKQVDRVLATRRSGSKGRMGRASKATSSRQAVGFIRGGLAGAMTESDLRQTVTEVRDFLQAAKRTMKGSAPVARYLPARKAKRTAPKRTYKAKKTSKRRK